MATILKLIGFVHLLVLGWAIYSPDTKPDVSVMNVAPALLVFISCVALGYLIDVRDALRDLKPKEPKNEQSNP